jgi:putative restriction endonuclease
MPPIDARSQFRFVVAVTDPRWFAFLAARPNLEEVNFWRPGAGATRFARGTPWFYLLRGTSRIVGGALFSTYARMPIHVAWDAFREGNGTTTFEELRDLIAQIRHCPPKDVGEIGCVALTQPFYASHDRHVDFGRLYGPLSSYDTANRDGAELWQRLSGLLPAMPAATAVSAGLPGNRPMVGRPTLRLARLGQGSFRIDVTLAYSARCAITDERTLPALEAAHIVPFSMTQAHDVKNGLLLRSDIHKLFDAGYVSVQPDLLFRVSKAIRDEFENGREYYKLNGHLIRVPEHITLQPDREALDWHYSTQFKG